LQYETFAKYRYPHSVGICHVITEPICGKLPQTKAAFSGYVHRCIFGSIWRHHMIEEYQRKKFSIKL